MYAVFQLSGFQYNAEEGAVIRVPLQNLEKGTSFDLEEILLIKDNDNVLIGSPLVEGAKIEAEIIEHGKADKIVIHKHKRRTKYRRTIGHRQDFSDIKIKKIFTPES